MTEKCLPIFCYVSKKLAGQLPEDFGISFFGQPKRNMKNQLMQRSRQADVPETFDY